MKKYLLNMLDSLSEHRTDKKTLMIRYIQERLNLSYTTYDKELEQSINFLKVKHEKSLVKRMK